MCYKYLLVRLVVPTVAAFGRAMIKPHLRRGLLQGEQQGSLLKEEFTAGILSKYTSLAHPVRVLVLLLLLLLLHLLRGRHELPLRDRAVA